jgi:hypothetical protein
MREKVDHVSGLDFSAYPGQGVYPFGFDGENAAAALRKLAALIESHCVLPQALSIEHKVELTEYMQTVLTFKYCEISHVEKTET